MKTLIFVILMGLVLACTNDDGLVQQDPKPIGNPDPDPDPVPENMAPDTFSLLQLANDSMKVGLTPTFLWETATDPDGDSVSYDLYLDTVEEPTAKIVESMADTTFTIDNTMPLSLARNYFWKVTARDDKGAETSSETFSFQVRNLDDAQRLTLTDSYGGRSNHTSVVFNDAMYILGGFSNGSFSSDSWASSNGEQWAQGIAQVSEKFTARFFHAATVYEDAIYILGGLVNGSFSNDMWSSTDGTTWLNQDQLSPYSERSEHTVTVHADKLWVIGGNSSEGKLGDVWSFKDGEGWTRTVETAAFGKRNFHQSVAFNDKLWVLGGIDDAGDFKNDVWSSTDGIGWDLETGDANFSPRGFHKALVFDNKIWIIGGFDPAGGLNDIWYSEDGLTWIDATPDNSFTPKDGFTTLFYDNKIWILGGNDTDEVWNLEY